MAPVPPADITLLPSKYMFPSTFKCSWLEAPLILKLPAGIEVSPESSTSNKSAPLLSSISNAVVADVVPVPLTIRLFPVTGVVPTAVSPLR